jgi:hypothetical protein
MYTVELPLTPAEIVVLERLAAAAKMTVGDFLVPLIREELASQAPLVPNLG